MKNILLIDDEKDVLKINKKYLEGKGMHIECAQNKSEVIELMNQFSFDCIVLDIVMKDTSGFDLCRLLKKMCDTPIIFLSNLTNIDDQIKGYLQGGDDYMTKPYDLKLLYLHIKARMKDQDDSISYNILEFPPLLINLDTREVRVNDIPVLLTVLEFEILVLLATHENIVFSLSEIFCKIWKQNDMDRPSTVQVHISNLRHKLEKAFPEYHFIQTSWGKGYYFNNVSS